MQTDAVEPAREPAVSSPPDVVRIRRRTIDTVLISLGVVAAIVFAIAGSLLTWGSRFANDYVGDELAAQNIVFPDAASLEEEGRTDLVKYAGESLNTGDEAEAYASYIGGHLEETAGGLTYAELGGPQSEARAELQAAVESGASEEQIAELQANVDEVTRQRDSLFRGETLRGLLLSTFAWSTMGRIAGIAATVAFAATAATAVLVILGFVHLRRATTT